MLENRFKTNLNPTDLEITNNNPTIVKIIPIVFESNLSSSTVYVWKPMINAWWAKYEINVISCSLDEAYYKMKNIINDDIDVGLVKYNPVDF